MNAIERLEHFAEVMFISKNDMDIRRFKSFFRICTGEKFYGVTVKVQAYLYYDEVVKRLAECNDKEFQKAVLTA